MIVYIATGSQSEQMFSYVIMPRYGQNLENYFESQNFVISESSVYELGKGILSLLEQVHAAGYVFNDLKLDNILVGFGNHLPSHYTSENIFASSSFHLIDFGFATRYVKRNKDVHFK